MLQCIITRKSGVDPKLKTIGYIKQSGTWTGSLSKTFDVKSVYSKYDKLTIDDFAINDNTMFQAYRNTITTYALNSLTKSYDASTGILTVTFKHSGADNTIKGSNFTFPIIILDRFNVGGVIRQLITYLANIGKEVLA